MDHRIWSIARSAGLVYTRYSDDLVLSGSGGFDRQEAARVIRRVRAAVSECGFTLHHNKTRVIPPRARHIVLGLLVDETEVRLLPEFRRRVEVHVRGTKKFGLAEHAASRRFRSIFSFGNHVDGCLAFASDVQPEWAATTHRLWREALATNAFPLEQERRSNGSQPPPSAHSKEQR